MHHRAKDITGLRSGCLEAVKYVGSDGKKSLWEIRCDCGAVKVMPATEIIKGNQTSCGCRRYITISEKQTKHGMSRHPAYAVWRSMVDRCRLPTHQAWARYGARGITVCDEWQSFEKFWQDMGSSYVPGLTLERRDNMGGYSAENCVWDTHKAQAGNTRKTRIINTPWGRMNTTEAARRAGIGATTLLFRIQRGWPEERWFIRPAARKRRSTS